MAAVFILLLISVMYPLLHVTLLETNIDRIEKFLLRNKNNPNFSMIYALANEHDEEVKEITQKLIQKYKARSRQALYKISEAIYFKNLSVAKTEIEYITSPLYRSYYQALISLEDGELDCANREIDKITNQWMKNALLAEREKKQGNIVQARQYAEIAKQKSKGLQRYLLHKTYEREF